MIIREIQFYISQIYNSIDLPYNQDFQYIKEASLEKHLRESERFNCKKHELDVQIVKIRNCLNYLTTYTEDMDRISKQCTEIIEKEREKQKKQKNMKKKYYNNCMVFRFHTFLIKRDR